MDDRRLGVRYDNKQCPDDFVGKPHVRIKVAKSQLHRSINFMWNVAVYVAMLLAIPLR